MQTHSFVGRLKNHKGRGFIVAVKINLAGKVKLPFTRETVTVPSSKGWRKLSKTSRLNSGNSSKIKTPRCDKVISPGLGTLPPPTKAAAEDV